VEIVSFQSPESLRALRSGILTRLAARAFGKESSLQPRQKARLIDLYAGVSASCSGCDEASAAVLLFDAQCY
jgi:hypothetical protein